MNNEAWKPIEGFPPYEVSNLGRVRGYRCVLRPCTDHSGYKGVILYNGSSKSFRSVHRLVASAFCDGWFDGAEVNHVNGDKSDNRAENLEWVTREENIQQRSKPPYRRAVLMDGEKRFSSVAEAARYAGCTRNGIEAVCRGFRSFYGGHRWEYA